MTASLAVLFQLKALACLPAVWVVNRVEVFVVGADHHEIPLRCVPHKYRATPHGEAVSTALTGCKLLLCQEGEGGTLSSLSQDGSATTQ